MKIIDMFRGNKGIPWENRKSIFEHIGENLLEDGCLDSNAVNLPDEDVRYKENDIRWVAGGMDGAFGHHESSNESNVELAKLTQKIATHGRTNDKMKFYNIAMEDNIISMIDNVLEEIIRMQVNITQNLMEWIEFLAFKSPDRGAVKVGIALIGAMGAENYKDRLKIIARHEEFTLYVSVALLNMSENAEQELWELAKYVHGWGRIELVERLSKTEKNDIKRWIL